MKFAAGLLRKSWPRDERVLHESRLFTLMRAYALRILCLFFLLCARFSAGSGSIGTVHMMSNPANHRFLALGDSYTIGESVDENDRWPVQLARLLRAEGISMEDPVIIAKTGWTTDELAKAIDEQDPRGPFDLVSLLIGVNNQYRGRSADEYRDEFRALLTRAIGFAGGEAKHVVVLSIPDWGVTPFAEGRDRNRIAREIDLFNAINVQETARAGCHYLDITPESRTAHVEKSLVASDGLHPSEKMYADWARRIVPKVLPFLKP